MCENNTINAIIKLPYLHLEATKQENSALKQKKKKKKNQISDFNTKCRIASIGTSLFGPVFNIIGRKSFLITLNL